MNSLVRVCLMAAVVAMGLGMASDADARGCFKRFKRDRCCKPACCEPAPCCEEVSDCGCGAPVSDCGCGGSTVVPAEEGTVVEPTEASPSDNPAVPEPPAAEEAAPAAEVPAEPST
jgi:hypothetical protein